MTDPTTSAPHTGAVRRWPADPESLGDTTRCPSCFSSLASAVCQVCGLDLRSPQAREVLASGRRILDEERRRRELIDGMFRAQQARDERESVLQARADASVAADASDAPVRADASVGTVAARPVPAAAMAHGDSLAPPIGQPVPLPPPVAVEVPPAPAVFRSPPTSPAVAHTLSVAAGQVPSVPPGLGSPPKRSGMQVFLLTLGVVLISVTAIVFLFVAYLVASLEVRSVVIAFASALVLGAAALLRRRRLPGTAEGVSAVAVVLLLLDVWIVRANGLFGSADLRPAAYSGLALLVVAAVLAGVRAWSGIRTLGISAAVLGPIGLFLVGFGVAPEGEPTTGLWLGGLLALVAAVAAALVRLPGAERVIALSAGVTGGCIAWWAAPFALPAMPWHALWAFAAVAAGWAILLGALFTRGRALGSAWRWVAAIAVGSALAAAPATAIALESSVEVAAWLAPTSAAVLAVVFSAVHRSGDAETRRLGHGLFAGAGAIAVLAAVPAGLAAGLHVGTLIFDAIGGWTAGTVELTEFTAATIVVPFVLAAAGVVAALAARRLPSFAWVAVALTGAGVVMIAASFGDSVATVVLLLLLAALCLLAAVATRTPLRGLVPVLAIVGPTAAALAWVTGFGTVGGWLWSTVGVLALTLAGWHLVARRWPAAATASTLAHAAAAALQITVAAWALAPWLLELGVPLSTAWSSPAIWVALVVGAVFAAAVSLRRSQAATFALAAPLLVVATVALVALTVLGGSSLRWSGALVLAVGAVLWALLGRGTGLAVASAAVAPFALTFTVVWMVGDVIRLPEQAELAAAAAVLACAAIAHLLVRQAGTGPVRLAWVVAVGMLTLIVTALALTGGDWVPLAVLAPVPLIIAALWGDPIVAATPMRHVAWASGVLAIAAWWTWLADDRSTVVELFTLPVAALCLAIGTLVLMRRPIPSREPAVVADGEAHPTWRLLPARTVLVAAGLAIAVLPSVAAAGDSTIRTIVLVAAGAIVLLATAFAPDFVRGVPTGLLSALAGASAAIGGALVHATMLAAGGHGGSADLWAIAALVTGVAAAFWWARAARSPHDFAEWLYAAGIAAGSLPLFISILARDQATARAAVLTLLLAVVHILSVTGSPRPFAGPVARWMSFGLMMIGILLGVVGGVDPLDVVIVPFAVALIVAGVFDLRQDPARSSWSALGPGLGVLLLPPLIADFSDPQLWRIVALGVVALVTLLAGIRWRLQAPFVLGGAVLLVHAIAQLWPWITWLYEAVWWWLWLGLAGVLLVVVAATYERQLRLARTTAARISALR